MSLNSTQIDDLLVKYVSDSIGHLRAYKLELEDVAQDLQENIRGFEACECEDEEEHLMRSECYDELVKENQKIKELNLLIDMFDKYITHIIIIHHKHKVPVFNYDKYTNSNNKDEMNN